MALLHHPVVNKNGDVIASAITNLDLHDISRASRTYGVRRFYVVTPLSDQRELAEKIISHWRRGAGATYNPQRKEALEMIRTSESLEEVMDHIRAADGEKPETVVTSARNSRRGITYPEFRQMLNTGAPYLLNFGTAWGLSDQFISESDHVLEPIRGNTGYNHLSVRSAASIILDRFGPSADFSEGRADDAIRPKPWSLPRTCGARG